MFLRGLRALLSPLLGLALLLASGAGLAAPVLLVTGDPGGAAYEEAVAAIRSALGSLQPGSSIDMLHWKELHPAHEAEAGTRIIVTVGSQAAQALAENPPRQPVLVLHTLLTRDAYQSLSPRMLGRASAIYLDQPVARQLALVAEALPQWQQLALISSPRSQRLAEALAAGARERGWRVVQEEIASERELYPALQRSLAQPAVLLALPDSALFNSHTIQNVLLTAYRQRAPVIGFSPAYVRAGALLALYSTPAQIGEQTADAVRAVLDGGPLPAAQGPRRFEVGINHSVARSLGIPLDPAEEIAARMARREGRP